ncbi:MAG: response regulator [Acidimicrobiia bacterium]
MFLWKLRAEVPQLDPAHSDDYLYDPELRNIFQEELSERASHLLEGAARLGDGEIDSAELETLARDAHTIKGNAGVMGFSDIAELALALEHAWRGLENGSLHASDELAGYLLEASELLPTLTEPTTISAARARALAGKLGEEEIRAPAAAPVDPSPGPPPPPQPDVTSSSAANPAQAINTPPLSPGAADEPDDLGGLLSSIEQQIIGANTRVDTAKLYRLINSIAEARLDAGALAASGEGASSEQVGALSGNMEALQGRALELASVSLRDVTDTFPQLVRYLCRRTGKEARFEFDAADAHVDRQIADHLREPLRHLVVNAVDHGIEAPDERTAKGKPASGSLAIRATTADGRLQITVEDDGRGIDWDRVAEAARADGLIDGEPSPGELSRLLFRRDFTTLDEPTDLSGDGEGLFAVAELTEQLNGALTIESVPGQGTAVVVTLPSSWSLQDVVLVRAEGKVWGISAAAVLATFPLAAADVRPGEDRMELTYQGHEQIPISSFAAAVGLPEVEPVEEVVVLVTRGGRIAVTVPEIVGRRQVAVKGLGPLLKGTPLLVGAAFLGGGEVVVIVEPNRLGERVRTVPSPVTSRARVLVVDDSMGVRQLVSAALTSHGFEALVAADAAEALAHLASESFDALVVDYAMPGETGVDLIRTIRERTISIPIVMVSAVASADDQAAAWEAGVDAYLDKFDLRTGVLASTLNSLVQLRSPRGES